MTGSLSWLCCPDEEDVTNCLRTLSALVDSPSFSSWREMYSCASRLRSLWNSGSCHFPCELAKRRKADSGSLPWRSSTINSAKSAGSAREPVPARPFVVTGKVAIEGPGATSGSLSVLGCLLDVTCGAALLPSGFSSFALCNLHRRTPSLLFVAELRQPCTAHTLSTNEPWYSER